jgi:hypothetical protein
VTRLGRNCVVLACMVCFVASAGACRTRRPPVEAPASPEAARPAEPVGRVATPPAPSPLPVPPVAGDRANPGDEATCALVAEPGDAVTTVALAERVDPSHAPHPTNDSERLLFGQIYETLVRVDCHGHPDTGLAASWRLDADGRTWTITLREHARFSDGTRLTAADVRASWSADGTGTELRPRVRRLVQSIVPVDERTLAVTLHSRADAPIALAHTDLAVARPAAGLTWPLGTRTDRAAPRPEASAGAGGAVITIERERVPPIRFLIGPGDPRDLLDRNVDLLLTRDRAALDYAMTLSQFRSVPLEWQRTLVLLAPGRAGQSSSLSEETRHAFASDAVRGEARGATGPFWWETLLNCVVSLPQVREGRVLSPRVLYDTADGAARDVAERLVGLVRAPNPPAQLLDGLLPARNGRTLQRTAGLPAEALARARRLGNDAGYIAALDRRPLDPCRDAWALTDEIPWLDLQAIVPLVETRLRAIVRKGRGGIVAVWDGGLHNVGADASR